MTRFVLSAGSRFIVVNPFAVVPARDGGQKAVLGLAQALASRQETELVCTTRRADRRDLPAGDAQLPTLALPTPWLQRKAVKAAAHWTGGADQDLGSMLFSGANRALQRHLLTRVRDGDVLVLAHPWLWPAARRVLAQRAAALVYDAHNVEHQLKQARLGDSRIARWLCDRVRQVETDLTRRADLVLTCTHGDATTLAAASDVSAERFLPDSKGIWPSPAAAEVACSRQGRPHGRRAVFVGSNHPPNNEAARWIVQVLAPAVPEWTFSIVGSCGPHARVRPTTPNVEVRGPVDDLLAELAAADVALNPVESGSGINMKVLDYLQCALPVLTTPLGARGFEDPAVGGLCVIERDRFATALRVLQAEPERQRRLSAAGPRTVAERFGWDAIADRLLRALSR